MTIRNPLIIVSGVFSQLPASDTVPGTDAVAQASGNAALSDVVVAQASGNAALVVGSSALSSGTSALASGNEALVIGVSALTTGTAALASGNAALADVSFAVTTSNTALASGNAAVTDAAAAVVTSNNALASGNLALTEVGAALASGNAALAYGVYALPYSGGVITGDISNTSSGYLGFPVGTTAERPAAPASGVVRYNASTTEVEAYKDAWYTLVSKNSAGDITVNSVNNSSLAGFRNVIINGDFSIWQRGVSFTSNEYTADRWRLDNSGSTHTTTRESFTLGQTDVPGEPEFYLQSAVTSSAGSANYARLYQRIEDVRTFAGQEVTLSFWAKADSSKSIAIEAVQYFGSTSGTPGTSVTGINPTKVTLSTSWQQFNVTFTVPTITGKSIGTDGDDYLSISFWLDAGSDYNARTDTLGQQSGTFSFSRVQLEKSPTATPFEQRPVGIEFSLCLRYYYKSQDINNRLFKASQGGPLGRSFVGSVHPFSVPMRTSPSIAWTDNVGNASRFTIQTTNNIAISAGSIVINPFYVISDIAFGSLGLDYQTVLAINFTANAEL